MSEPMWPAHWADPETTKHQLMEQDFTEEEADIIIEGLRYVLHGGKGVVLQGEETDD